MLFSYPCGTISDPHNFSISELYALKPLMKAKCIRTEREFENSFNQMMDFRLNKLESETAVTCRHNRLRQEALNSYPLRWLAQRRNFSDDLLVFFTDKLSTFLSSLSKIENDLSHFDFINFENDYFIQVSNLPDAGSVKIEMFNMVFECKHHENLPKTLAKLRKYTDRFIDMLVRSIVTVVVPFKPTIDSPLEYAISLNYKLQSFQTEKSITMKTLLGSKNLGINHYEKRSYEEPKLIAFVDRVKSAFYSDLAPHVLQSQLNSFEQLAQRTLAEHQPLKPTLCKERVLLQTALGGFQVELNKSTWQYICSVNDPSTEKFSELKEVA